MIGIIVELIISWILLWLICKEHLSVLGFRPTTIRVTHLITGFAIAACCCTLWQMLTVAFIDNHWTFNKLATARGVLKTSGMTLISVLYEELIFRGALLYILIKKTDTVKACILSAAGFGIYHWFSYGVFGNPLMMVIVFVMTATVGLSWAFAFAKTGSLYLPTGLHLGWNLFSIVVFSNGNFGQALLVKATANQPQGILSWMIFLFQVCALPLFTFWYVNRLSKNNAVSKAA